MDDYNRIIEYCTVMQPTIVYVGIGCSLGWNHRDPSQLQQQYPAILDTFPEPRVCILIDPLLEYPPRATMSSPSSDLPILNHPAYTRSTDPIVKQGTTFFPIYRDFEFIRSYDADFLHALCSQCVRTNGDTKLIVQDYTGRDIRPYYPSDIFGDAIRPFVLYDMTYRDPGCYVDFSTVHVLRDESGNFIHPSHCTLRKIRQVARVGSRILQDEIKRRTDIVINYLYRRYAVQAGYKEHADWCSPANIAVHLQQLIPAYGLPAFLTQTNLKQAMVMCLQDVGGVMDKEVSSQTICDLLDKNSSDFINLAVFLRNP